MIGIGLALLLAVQSTDENLAQNARFEEGTTTPLAYELSGGAKWSAVSYLDEFASKGVALSGGEGSVSQKVSLRRGAGRWVTFKFRGRAEDGFAVKNDALWMRIDFLADDGKRPMESARRLIYREILRDRKDLAVNGDGRKGGANVWRTYEFEELLPFNEVDTVRVSVGFKDGASTDPKYGRFMVDDFSVVQRTHSTTGKIDPQERVKAPAAPVPVDARLVHLGGRWYYQPAEGETVSAGLVVNYRNANRLLYKEARWTAPFADNMTSWLRPGFLDKDNNLVTKDRFLPDNVTISIEGDGTMRIHSKDVPNHPTAKFPDTYGTQNYNPSYIKEVDRDFTIPLDPKKAKGAIAMDANDKNGALNMGPVGLAVNGVVFFNPFDATMVDAADGMDRCCGHPSPGFDYHYHKYPVCVNTPYADKGDAHSPIIGFALDGFPLYGPYESEGTLARDLTTNKLDAFNAHYDEQRGWHYHVTPGKFPYIIGGYMGWAK